MATPELLDVQPNTQPVHFAGDGTGECAAGGFSDLSAELSAGDAMQFWRFLERAAHDKPTLLCPFEATVDGDADDEASGDTSGNEP